jgi:hypothetical protein
MTYTFDPTDIIILFIIALSIGASVDCLIGYAARSVRRRA